MRTVTITSSQKPNEKEQKKLRGYMRTEQIGRLVVRVKNGGSTDEMVLELEKKDAEGRDLLYG